MAGNSVGTEHSISIDLIRMRNSLRCSFAVNIQSEKSTKVLILMTEPLERFLCRNYLQRWALLRL
jgi:hypothetical protein